MISLLSLFSGVLLGMLVTSLLSIAKWADECATRPQQHCPECEHYHGDQR